MAVMGFEVFDGDGHVLENDDEIASYFEGRFRQPAALQDLRRVAERRWLGARLYHGIE